MKLDLVLINKKKITCRLDKFNWVKIKRNEKLDSYLDLARELKYLEYEDQCDIDRIWRP